MARLTVSKTVYWDDGSREISGKIKQILQDHAVIGTTSGQYIVAMDKLSLKPMQKSASCSNIIISAQMSTKPPFNFAEMEAKAAKMTDAQLEYALRDIKQALEAYPNQPNEGWYMDEMHVYLGERNKRKASPRPFGIK